MIRMSSKTGIGFTNISVKSSGGHIQHPHAHYNKLGELKCLICGIRIKGDALWQTHLASKAHQLNLRSQSSNQNSATSPRASQATALQSFAASDIKKRSAASIITATSPKRIGLVSNLASYDVDDGNCDVSSPPNDSNSASSSGRRDAISRSKLPADFFDANTAPISSKPKIPEPPEKSDEKAAESLSSSTALPEGFFDDPKLDAKKRDVPFVDKGEVEWAEFQKTIKEEQSKWEKVLEAEDADKDETRILEEIDEQYSQWTRVHELEQRVLDPARASSEQQPASAPSSSSTASNANASSSTAHEVVVEPLFAVKAEPKMEPEETKLAGRSSEPGDFDDADADALGLGDWRSKHI